VNQRDVNQLDAAHELVKWVLGDTIVGAYHYGSGVLGGLRPSSDIDVFVLLGRRTSFDQRRSLVTELMAVSGHRGSRISGRSLEVTMACRDELRPWRRNPRREFQYGEWLRHDYEAGFVPEPVIDSDLAPLVATLLTASRTLVGPPAEVLLNPVPADDLVSAMRRGVPGLLDELSTDTVNVLLTLARIAYTILHGRVVTKDVAASWAVNALAADLRGPLEHARLTYLGEIGSPLDGFEGNPEETAMQLVAQMIDPVPG